MRLLALGDIHGNIIALEKVLKTFFNEADMIICHGDVVNYGPWSNECVALLSTYGITVLLGNHERAFLNGFYPGSNPLVRDFFNQTYPDFKYNDQIGKYNETAEIDGYSVVHTINEKYYYPDSNMDNLNLTRDTIIGHSHYPFFKILDNGKTLTNTGSIGQNRMNLSICNFAMIDTSTKNVTIKEIGYNPSLLIKEMEIRNYPKQCLDYYKGKLK